MMRESDEDSREKDNVETGNLPKCHLLADTTLTKAEPSIQDVSEVQGSTKVEKVIKTR